MERDNLPASKASEITLGIKPNRISYFVTSLFRYFVKHKGFTLVELIVSVAITGILMLGISVFFSSSFQGLFRAQTQTTNTEKQYAINEIIRDKFTTLDKVLNKFSNDPPTADKILFKNKNTKGQLPFSYIGVTEKDNNGDSINEKYLALKDMLIFNKVYHGDGNDFFADSGEGKIKRADIDSEVVPKLNPPDDFINFSSFEIIGAAYYIVFPDKNRVMKCPCSNGVCQYDSCTDLPGLPQLLSPTDIAKDDSEDNLFITDSGNGRVIKYTISNQTSLVIATPLKYPTGLAYYNDTSKEWLFVAETLGNQIRKINLASPYAMSTVVGEGDDETCVNTAKFCQLNMPTGLYAFDDAIKKELYIADSGNSRILRVKDPEVPDSLTFEFSLDENYTLDRIEFGNSSWKGNGTYDESGSNLIGKSSDFSKAGEGKEVFKNSDRLTTFKNSVCPKADEILSKDSFYVNEKSDEILEVGDKVIIDNDIFTVKTIPSETECQEAPENPSLIKWKIGVDEDASGISDGQTVFFSNPNKPTDVAVRITGIPDDDFAQGGFQTFTIKTYDLMKGLVETDYYPIRIGDGELGTDEDTIEVINNSAYEAMSFPTGVTDKYFANSGGKEGNTTIMTMGVGPYQNFSPVDVSAFEIFDYISDFALKTDEPLQFTEYNEGKLLELVINALVDEEKSQVYTLNANIPQ